MHKAPSSIDVPSANGVCAAWGGEGGDENPLLWEKGFGYTPCTL